MQHRYFVQGVTCSACKKSLTAAWLAVDGIRNVQFSDNTQVIITMDNHVSLAVLQDAITHLDQYALSDVPFSRLPSWLITYRPLFIIFGIIVAITSIHTLRLSVVGWDVMMVFMGWWFIVFAGLKLVNLPGFVAGYISYDIVASRRAGYAWIYPFIELFLGIVFLLGFFSLGASVLTLVIMIVSTIGVRKALGRKIQCVCIGTWFSLPLTKVTIVENLVMAAMALVMIVLLLM